MSDDKQGRSPESEGSFFGKLIKFILIVSLVAHGGMLGYYYHKHGAMPDSPKAFYTFSYKEGMKGQEAAREYLASIDWEKIKDKVTEKTKSLFEKTSSYLDGKEPPEPRKETGDKTEGATAETDAGGEENISEEYYTEYKQGYDALKEALGFYRKSAPTMPNYKENLDKALPKFEEARTHFEKAKKANPEDKEVDKMLEDIQLWIYDCQKRQTL